MNYGHAIRLARSTRGWSQKDLARQLEADPSFISQLESNKRAPSAETLESLAESFQIPMYLLIFLASEKEDLKGIPQKQAQLFGQELLRMLTKKPSEKRK